MTSFAKRSGTVLRCAVVGSAALALGIGSLSGVGRAVRAVSDVVHIRTLGVEGGAPLPGPGSLLNEAAALPPGPLPRGLLAPPTVPLTGRKLPGLGLLGATSANFAAERAAGIEFVTVAAGWDLAEPSLGVFSTAYIASVKAKVSEARQLGLQVVLDPGVQYSPAWVFNLPGGTRFVDQYGDVFTGAQASGDDVANAVTDLAVRSAESAYLQWLGSEIAGRELAAVRVGGGPDNELRYPSGAYHGHTDCFWAYDASTQANSPVPGWRPGTGTVADAQSFLDAYNGNLVSYGSWLTGTVAADFGTDELVMLPDWGERPGVAHQETASLLTLGHDEFSEGLDWANLLPSLPHRADVIAYTTYLDAPAIKNTPQLSDPADYIASIARPLGMREGGENTGDGTLATMDLVVKRALRLHMVIVNWMDEAQVIASNTGLDPAGPRLSDLRDAALELAAGRIGPAGGHTARPAGP